MNEERQERIEKVMQDLGNVCNSFDRDYKPFFEAFCREHRTIQQTMFSVMLSLISSMASEEYHTDGRNERSKEVAKMLIEGYAEMEKQKYLSEFRSTDSEFLKERAESLKQAIIANPSDYLRMPCI